MRKLLFIAWMTLLLASPGITFAQTAITVPSTATSSTFPGFFVNISDPENYGNYQVLRNLIAPDNPSFMPQTAQTMSMCAGGGTTNQWTDLTPTYGATPQATNFWATASYQVISGSNAPTVAQIKAGTAGPWTGTVSASTQATTGAGETYSMTPTTGTLGACTEYDMMLLRLRNPPAGWSGALTPQQMQTAQYFGLSGSGQTFNASDTSPHSNNHYQSLQLPSGSGVVMYADGTFNSQQFIRMNGSYTVSWRAKATSAATLTATVSRGGNPVYLTQSVTPTVSTTNNAGWTDYSYTFTASETTPPSQPIAFQISSSGGTVLIGDMALTEASNTPANTTVYRDSFFSYLQARKEAGLRYMATSNWGCSLDDEIAPFGGGHICNFGSGSSVAAPHVNAAGIEDFLVLCKALGVQPFFTLSFATTPADITNLVEFLNGGSGTTYGAKRIALGQTAAWSTVFPNLYFEPGNEVWNGANSGASMQIDNGTAYGHQIGTMMIAAKAAPDYSSNIKIIASGWGAPNQTGSAGWNGQVLSGAHAISTTATVDLIDAAPYQDAVHTQYSTTDAVFKPKFTEPVNLDSLSGGYMNTCESYAYSTYGVHCAVYEVNQANVVALTGITQAQMDQFDASVGTGIALAEHMTLMATDSALGGPITAFTLPGKSSNYTTCTSTTSSSSCSGGSLTEPLWGLNIYESNGPGQALAYADRPTGVAVGMLQSATANGIVKPVACTQSGTPTYSQAAAQPNPLQGGANNIAANSAAPLVLARCFTDGAGNYAMTLFNLNTTANESVTWSGAGAPTGTVTKYVLGGSSAALIQHNEATTAPTGTPAVAYPSSSTLTNPTGETMGPATFETLNWSTSTPTAATVTFSPAAGTFTAAQSVSLSCATASSTVYYTTNGSTPTTGSSVYSAPISVGASETLEAICAASGYTTSAASSAAYTINIPVAATPMLSVAAGTYASAQTVTISDATAGAAIYYTTNGSTPTTSSTLYSGPVSVGASETLSAIAVASGYTNSAAGSAAYVINIPTALTPAATPVLSPLPGAYTTSPSVTLTTATSGAVIHYTTDGTTPTSTSPTYSAAIPVTSAVTVKAIAVKSGMANSPLVSGAYSVMTINCATISGPITSITAGVAFTLTVSCKATN